MRWYRGVGKAKTLEYRKIDKHAIAIGSTRRHYRALNPNRWLAPYRTHHLAVGTRT